MQTPMEIDFQGMAGTAGIHEIIAGHVGELEDRYGRMTACRVVLKAPGGRHQTSGLYEVNIRLALPNGREVNVAQPPAPTSGTPTGRLLSMTPSSERAASCRTRPGVCGVKSSIMKALQ